LHEQPSSIREPPAAAVHASPTAGAWAPDLPRGLAIGVAGGLFLSLTGAFSTGEAPLPLRTAYWVGMCLGGALAGAAVSAAAVRIGGLGARRWLLAGLTTGVLTLLLTPAVWMVTELVFSDGVELARLPDFLPPVAVITAAMTAVTFVSNQRPRVTQGPPAGAPPPGPGEQGGTATEPARFLERLPPKLRGASLFAVESEDHYLRLHTSRGQDLILMRLSDAVAELEGLQGAQTHRSWWVARDGYTGAERHDGRAVLRLRNGEEAPVSRTYAKALRTAGWF
jgi:hypothetical protein